MRRLILTSICLLPRSASHLLSMGFTIFWVAFNELTSHSYSMQPNRMAQLFTLLLEMFTYYFMPNNSRCSNHDALQLGLQTEGRRTFIILMWVCPFFFSCAIRDKLVCSWLGAQHRVLTWDGDFCKHFQTDLIFPPSWIKVADSHKGDRAMDNNLSAFGTVTDWMSWPYMWAILFPYDIYFSLFSFFKDETKNE